MAAGLAGVGADVLGDAAEAALRPALAGVAGERKASPVKRDQVLARNARPGPDGRGRRQAPEELLLAAGEERDPPGGEQGLERQEPFDLRLKRRVDERHAAGPPRGPSPDLGVEIEKARRAAADPRRGRRIRDARGSPEVVAEDPRSGQPVDTDGVEAPVDRLGPEARNEPPQLRQPFRKGRDPGLEHGVLGVERELEKEPVAPLCQPLAEAAREKGAVVLRPEDDRVHGGDRGGDAPGLPRDGLLDLEGPGLDPPHEPGHVKGGDVGAAGGGEDDGVLCGHGREAAFSALS